MGRKNFIKGVLFSFLSALCFATLVVLIRVGYNVNFTTLRMLFIRFLFAVILFGFFIILFKRNRLIFSVGLIFKAFITGTILYAVQAFLFFKAVRFVSPNVVELLLYMYPAFVSVLSFLFFKERFSFIKFVYIGIILMGFAFIFNSAFSSRIEVEGVFLAFSAMIVYSFYLVMVQKFVKDEDPLIFSFFTILFAFLSFLVLVFTKEGVFIPTLKQLEVGLLLGLIPTFFAILFLFIAVKEIGSALASVFSSVEPLLEIVLCYLILGIGLSVLQLVGGAFIIAGVFIADIYHIKEIRSV